MGLFDKFFKTDVRKEYELRIEPIDDIDEKIEIQSTPWKIKAATKTYRMPFERESKIYTFDASPLKGMVAGDTFIAVAVPAKVQIVSSFEGVISSTNDGDVAFEYNGEIFGMASAYASMIKKLMKKGYRVEVEARITGFDERLGYPKVVGKLGGVDKELLS